MSDTDSPPVRRQPIMLRLVLLAAVGLSVLASACAFIVSETEHVLILRFGRPDRIISTPGLCLRLPVPIERVVRVDRRLQHASIRLSETLTRDQRNVIVPVFFTWRVADPLRFHTAVREFNNAQTKLDALITSARNSVLGQHDFTDLLMTEESDSSLAKMEREMLALASGDAAQQLGIELISAGITQIQLPEANTESVFRRMRAERKREATQYRAEGRAKTAEMKAETDKEATRMIADAKRQAEEMRGKAEAEASSIYAAAHGQDPQFYKFLRELQSLRTVVDKNTTVILDTSVAPFHWLKAKEPGAVADKPTSSPPAAPSASILDQTP
ncbi:membrane protease subunit HflC [Prosthecobacter debontii]|uniref:Protein HflC n=1 Tax=Prosthecobacter debontii TaxID=48467 RepID=A0A1T4WLJ8_9BACT|nr:protease modulator HflC [Prosthecobacter debontii]SKA77768.1 membrane protease subunit HflC [Prosthecobacter debontii]